MVAILKTAAILNLKIPKMNYLGKNNLKFMYCLTLYVSFKGNFIILLIFLAAILFYANYLKLPKADSEPTKIFCKLGILANKIC